MQEGNTNNGEIWACASCNEMIFPAGRSKVIYSMATLPPTFCVTKSEMSRFEGIPIDIVRDHLMVLIGDDRNTLYHLNPDLVPDRSQIHVCSKCSKDPHSHKYSIANGHDYGRRGNLPKLSGVALACICPVRCFGTELSLSAKHSTGHCICFLSDGPTQCAKVLPVVDDSVAPRVTFIGSHDQWRIAAKKFRNLWEIPVDDIYKNLRVLSAINNVFKRYDIHIDDSDERHVQLQELGKQIDTEVNISNSLFVHCLNDNLTSDRFGSDLHTMESNKDDNEITMLCSAVLKNPILDGPGSASHVAAIDAMLGIISHGDEPQDKQQHGPTTAKNDPPCIPISRNAQPKVEWDENGELLAGIFVDVFMTGDAHLPNGPLSTDFINHLFLLYDG